MKCRISRKFNHIILLYTDASLWITIIGFCAVVFVWTIIIITVGVHRYLSMGFFFYYYHRYLRQRHACNRIHTLATCTPHLVSHQPRPPFAGWNETIPVGFNCAEDRWTINKQCPIQISGRILLYFPVRGSWGGGRTRLQKQFCVYAHNIRTYNIYERIRSVRGGGGPVLEMGEWGRRRSRERENMAKRTDRDKSLLVASARACARMCVCRVTCACVCAPRHSSSRRQVEHTHTHTHTHVHIYIYIYAAPVAGRQFKGRIRGSEGARWWCIATWRDTAAREGSRRERWERGRARARDRERGGERARKRESEWESKRWRESIDSGSPGLGFQSIPLGPRLTRLAVLPKPSVL